MHVVAAAAGPAGPAASQVKAPAPGPSLQVEADLSVAAAQDCLSPSLLLALVAAVVVLNLAEVFPVVVAGVFLVAAEKGLDR